MRNASLRLLPIVLLLAGTAWAADPKPVGDDEETVAAPRTEAGSPPDAEPVAASASKQAPAPPTGAKQADERFKPTEEISEDLSVSFPSDI